MSPHADDQLTTPRGPGRPTFYGPKDGVPVTLSLTVEAKALLAHAVARTGASRSDVVEQLLRRFVDRVSFPRRRA